MAAHPEYPRLADVQIQTGLCRPELKVHVTENPTDLVQQLGHWVMKTPHVEV